MSGGRVVEDRQWVAEQLGSRVVGEPLADAFTVGGSRRRHRRVFDVSRVLIVAVMLQFPLWLVLVPVWKLAALQGWLPAGAEAVAALLMRQVELVFGGEVSSGGMFLVQSASVSLLVSVVVCALVEFLRVVLVIGGRRWLTQRRRRLAVPEGADFSDVVVVSSWVRREVVVYQRPEKGGLLKLGVIGATGMRAGGGSEWGIDDPSGLEVRVGAWGSGGLSAEGPQWSAVSRDDGVSSLVARWWAVRRRRVEQEHEFEEWRRRQKAVKGERDRARRTARQQLVED